MNFLIVDDHKLFADGLSNLLAEIFPEPKFTCVSSGREALQELTRNVDFDLILLDLRLTDMDGIEVLRKMSEARYLVPTAIISATSDYQEVYAALQQGALGFIHKSIDRDELETAINSILAGEKYLSDLSGGAADESQPLNTQVDILTKRQKEVLDLLSEGLLNKQIAERLGTSEHTIKIHVSAIMKKLGVRTRTACVNQAMRMGMLKGS